MISILNHWSCRRTSPNLAVICILFALVLAPGCVSKPIQIRTLDGVTGAPVADVDIRQHGVRWFSFFPKKGKAPKTNADGQLDLVLNSRSTCLAVLRPGYVPTQVSIVPEPEGRLPKLKPTLLVADISPINCVEFESLADLAVVEVRLTPIIQEKVRISVRDDQGVPLANVDVILETGLFLPKDGVEGEWGRPPIERIVTNASGVAVVTVHIGLRNYIYVRMLGRESQRIAFERLADRKNIDITLRSIASKRAIIRVIDGKSGAPIAGANVELGKQFDGIPCDPNGWTVKTDVNGCTPQVSIPDFSELIVTASAEKYLMRRRALIWQAVDAKKPVEIELDRK